MAKYGECIKVAKKTGVPISYVRMINHRRLTGKHNFYSDKSKRVVKALERLDKE